MTEMQVSRQSTVPYFQQIVTQLSFMIRSGDLPSGHLLPSARLLADNLRINRNTVARAYAELAALGLVESRGRNGTVVVWQQPEPQDAPEVVQARQDLERSVRACLDLGMSGAEVDALVTATVMRAESDRLRVSFVECNADRARYFADGLSEHLGLPVDALVLGEFTAADQTADLVLTTFFHLAQVRNLWPRSATEVVAIVVAPHVQTLVQVASVPADRTVGILYRTEEQATWIKDSLAQAGLANIRVVSDPESEQIDDLELLVIPSETPELRARLEQRVRVIEYGNVLDAASLRMVTEVVADMQAAKRAEQRNLVRLRD